METPMYTLCIRCPHCAYERSVSGDTLLGHTSVLFVCSRDADGCGGHGLLEPPDLNLFPHITEVVVTPQPLTRPQVKRLIRERGMPHGLGPRVRGRDKD